MSDTKSAIPASRLIRDLLGIVSLHGFDAYNDGIAPEGLADTALIIDECCVWMLDDFDCVGEIPFPIS